MLINNKLIEIKTYTNHFNKFKGLMFVKDFDYGLKLRCNGIHTFFMFQNIDVVLTDKNNNVLFIYKNLKRNRILWPKKNVYYTYELPAGTITDLEINSQIKTS